MLGVVVNLERPVALHEVGVGFRMVPVADLVPVQGRADELLLLLDRRLGGRARQKVIRKQPFLAVIYILQVLDGVEVSRIMEIVLLLNQHLLERLRVGPVVDQGLQLVRLDVLNSLLACLHELLLLEGGAQLRVLLLQLLFVVL